MSWQWTCSISVHRCGTVRWTRDVETSLSLSLNLESTLSWNFSFKGWQWSTGCSSIYLGMGECPEHFCSLSRKWNDGLKPWEMFSSEWSGIWGSTQIGECGKCVSVFILLKGCASPLRSGKLEEMSVLGLHAARHPVGLPLQGTLISGEQQRNDTSCFMSSLDCTAFCRLLPLQFVLMLM